MVDSYFNIREFINNILEEDIGLGHSIDNGQETATHIINLNTSSNTSPSIIDQLKTKISQLPNELSAENETKAKQALKLLEEIV